MMALGTLTSSGLWYYQNIRFCDHGGKFSLGLQDRVSAIHSHILSISRLSAYRSPS